MVPAPPACESAPSRTTPHATPGIFASLARRSNRSSTAGSRSSNALIRPRRGRAGRARCRPAAVASMPQQSAGSGAPRVTPLASWHARPAACRARRPRVRAWINRSAAQADEAGDDVQPALTVDPQDTTWQAGSVTINAPLASKPTAAGPSSSASAARPPSNPAQPSTPDPTSGRMMPSGPIARTRKHSPCAATTVPSGRDRQPADVLRATPPWRDHRRRHNRACRCRRTSRWSLTGSPVGCARCSRRRSGCRHPPETRCPSGG